MNNSELKYRMIRAINEMCIVSNSREFRVKADKVLKETINSPSYMLGQRVIEIKKLVLKHYPEDDSLISYTIIQYMNRIEELWEEEKEE